MSPGTIAGRTESPYKGQGQQETMNTQEPRVLLLGSNSQRLSLVNLNTSVDIIELTQRKMSTMHLHNTKQP